MEYQSEAQLEQQFYLKLLDTKNYTRNIFQVTNQITVKEKYTNRYDVTILINGLPLIQIEITQNQTGLWTDILSKKRRTVDTEILFSLAIEDTDLEK